MNTGVDFHFRLLLFCYRLYLNIGNTVVNLLAAAPLMLIIVLVYKFPGYPSQPPLLFKAGFINTLFKTTCNLIVAEVCLECFLDIDEWQYFYLKILSQV